jgi:hypothetical protein
MNDRWALLLGLGTPAGSSDKMIARYDAISMGNSIPSYAPNPLPNAGFEDTRMIGSGAGSYPVGGWTGGAQYPNDNVPGFSTDSYQGNWSWEQSLQGMNDSWKWIGFDFYSGNVPDFIAFACEEVSGASGSNLIEVWFEDHSQSPVQRMCYEFSTNPTQVRGDGWDGYAYSYVYHEKIDLNTWYYKIKNWKADWQNKLGYIPNMNHFWRIALSIDSFHVASPIVARYDSIWLGNFGVNVGGGAGGGGGGGGGGGRGGGGSSLFGIPVLMVVSAVFLVLLILGVVGLAARRSGENAAGSGPAFTVRERVAARSVSATEEELITPVRPRLTCPSCGAAIRDSAAVYCRYCGANLGTTLQSAPLRARRAGKFALGSCIICGLRFQDGNDTVKCPYCGGMAHRIHMLEWLHVKDYCPICLRQLEERDLQRI